MKVRHVLESMSCYVTHICEICTYILFVFYMNDTYDTILTALFKLLLMLVFVLYLSQMIIENSQTSFGQIVKFCLRNSV